MNTTRIIASSIIILYGLKTFVGYWLVLEPREALIDPLAIALNFSFAGLGILGGVLAILNKKNAAIALVLACVLYAVAALYQPVKYLGLSAINSLHHDTYISFAVRCILAAVIILILYKSKTPKETIT
jgi:hypothetical protein